MKHLSLLKIFSLLIIALFICTACASSIPASTEKTQPTASPQQETTAVPKETKVPAATDKPVNAVAKTVKVNIVNFTFDPATVNINKGDTIIWTNSDAVAHTATGTAFDSGSLSKGATFKFTFNAAGAMDYICTFHPNMKGQVIVK